MTRLSAHNSSQNHYRDQDAGDDQAKGYGGRDNSKFAIVLCEMQAWEQQSSKIIFQHEKPLVDIKLISAPVPFKVHTFFGNGFGKDGWNGGEDFRTTGWAGTLFV
jgi:hypothetical protein